MNDYVTKDHMCFACSPYNPIGLKLDFKTEGEKVYAVFTPGEEHQGYNGFLHGGLISTLLDEAMAQWLWINGYSCMTAEMNARYSKAVKINQEIKVEAICLSNRRGRVFEMESQVLLPEGAVAARAKAKFLPVDLDSVE